MPVPSDLKVENTEAHTDQHAKLESEPRDELNREECTAPQPQAATLVAKQERKGGAPTDSDDTVTTSFRCELMLTMLSVKRHVGTWWEMTVRVAHSHYHCSLLYLEM